MNKSLITKGMDMSKILIKESNLRRIYIYIYPENT